MMADWRNGAAVTDMHAELEAGRRSGCPADRNFDV